MKKALLKLSAFLLLPGILLAGSKEEKIPEKILVAAIYGLTGRAAYTNRRHLQGAIFAVEEINKNGGLLGRPVDLIIYDNQSTAVGSADAAKKAVKRGVVGIIGASWSSHSLAIAPVAQKGKIPMITGYSTNPKITQVGDYIFRVCFTDQFQAAAMAQFVRTNLQFSRLAILYESGNEFSQDLARYFQEEFEKRGGKIAMKLPLLKDSIDYSDPLGKIKTDKVEAIFLPLYDKESGLVMKQAYKKDLFVPFLGAGWGEPDKYLEGPIKDAYDIKPWIQESKEPVNQKFVRAYQARFGEKEILPGSPHAYDAMMLLAHAIRKAESTNPKKIREALARVDDFMGATGPIRFNKDRNPAKGAVMTRYLNSKRYEYLTTVIP